MKKTIVLLCALLWLSVSGIAGQEKTPSVDLKAEQVAKGYVSLLAKGDFQKATADFDNNMKAAAPPEELEKLWKSLLTAQGDFQKVEDIRIETKQQYRFVFVTCKFQKQHIDIKVTIDKSDKIAGMSFFMPTKSTQTDQYRTPDYANASLFKENDVTIGSGEWTLPGTLTIPSGKGPFPAVILVHGSGPHDRDESIGPNKPFRDLAWGLASQGIAVLRYEKRTLKFSDIKELTVKEETITDAIAAVSLLQKTEGIDSGRIFVLGHSLGGMLAPRIAAGSPKIAGLIILAGAARPLEDLIVEQTLYQASLSGKINPDDQKKIDELKRAVASIKALSKESKDTGMILNAPVSYWLDLKGYNPASVAKTLKQPMFILQGENDCQVSMKDFNIWRNTLSSRTDVILKSYPSLNHFFMKVSAKSTGAEYQQINNVSGTAISDIAGWIKKH